MIEGTVEDLKTLEVLMEPHAKLLKDTSDKSKAHIKLYKIGEGNPSYKIARFFYDLRVNKATLKIRDYYPCVGGVGAYLLVYTGAFMQDAIKSIMSLT